MKSGFFLYIFFSANVTLTISLSQVYLPKGRTRDTNISMKN